MKSLYLSEMNEGIESLSSTPNILGLKISDQRSGIGIVKLWLFGNMGACGFECKSKTRVCLLLSQIVLQSSLSPLHFHCLCSPSMLTLEQIILTRCQKIRMLTWLRLLIQWLTKSSSSASISRRRFSFRSETACLEAASYFSSLFCDSSRRLFSTLKDLACASRTLILFPCSRASILSLSVTILLSDLSFDKSRLACEHTWV